MYHSWLEQQCRSNLNFLISTTESFHRKTLPMSLFWDMQKFRPYMIFKSSLMDKCTRIMYCMNVIYGLFIWVHACLTLANSKTSGVFLPLCSSWMKSCFTTSANLHSIRLIAWMNRRRTFKIYECLLLKGFKRRL